MLHMCGVEILPLPCLVTLCAMQMLTVMSASLEVPQKLTKDSASLHARCEAVASKLLHMCKEAPAGCETCMRCAAGLALAASLGRLLRLIGLFGPDVQTASVACVASLCGGGAFLGFMLAPRFGAAEPQQDSEPCDSRGQHEDAFLAGSQCPYQRDFWPLMSHDAAEQAALPQENEDANFLASLCPRVEEAPQTKMTEDLDSLVESECRSLFAFAM